MDLTDCDRKFSIDSNGANQSYFHFKIGQDITTVLEVIESWQLNSAISYRREFE